MCSEIVYVGRSISARDGLGQRIYDHIYNRESSDLNQRLGGDPELTKRHLIRSVEIPDYDTGRSTKHFGIAALSRSSIVELAHARLRRDRNA
jgi:hypothetical protein